MKFSIKSVLTIVLKSKLFNINVFLTAFIGSISSVFFKRRILIKSEICSSVVIFCVISGFKVIFNLFSKMLSIDILFSKLVFNISTSILVSFINLFLIYVFIKSTLNCSILILPLVSTINEREFNCSGFNVPGWET